MIERAKFWNFQRHETVDVTFGPVTVICGKNDSGKSSLLRAIRWVLYNHPRGDGFKRWGADSVKGKLWIDGRTVRRERGTGGNHYYLDKERYTSFDANTVPTPIARLLNVGADNSQAQDDPAFWFSNTAGEVSKKLNAIVNLSEIDEALEFAASEVRRSKAVVAVTQDRLDAAESSLADSDWVVEFDRDLTRLESLWDDWQAAESKRFELEQLVVALEFAETRVRRWQDAYDAGVELVELGQSWADVRTKRIGIQSLVNEIDRLESLLGDAPDLSPVVELKQKAEQAAERRSELEVWVTRAEELEAELCELESELADQEKKLKSMTAYRCPTCGSVVRKDTAQ